jgi:outer membrane cobalamin receptor
MTKLTTLASAVLACAFTFHDSLAQPSPDTGSGSATATAPASEPEPAAVLGDEVITISGSAPPDRNKTGASVNVVTQQDIQALPRGDSQVLSDVLATQPGVVRDVYGIELFHIHGLENGVLYQIDGIPIMYGAAESFADVIPTRLLDSVDLITGGMPAEYGANGGVVDMTTRRPSETPAGEVQLVYGSYNMVQPAANYAQSFGKTDVLVGGNYLTTDYGLGAPQITPIVHDAEVAGTAFGKLDFRPSVQDHYELLTEWSAHHYQIPIDTTLEPLTDAPPGAVRGTDAYGNSPPQFVPYDANPTEREQDLLAAGSYVHDGDTTKLQVSPYFRYSTVDLYCDPSHALGATADPSSSCTNLDRRVLHEGVSGTYAWDVGTQKWKAGVAADDAQEDLGFALFTNRGSTDGGVNPSATRTGGDDMNVFQAGAFAQDELAVGKATIFPGVRLDLENAAYGGASTLPDLLLVGPSAKLGFMYAFSPALLLHAAAGYIWTNPQTVDAPIAAAALIGVTTIPAGDNLKAERDEQAEVGLTYRVPRQVKLDVTAWGRYSQDTIDWQTVGPSLLLENFNWAKGRAIGADFSVNTVVNPYLTTFASVSPQIAEGKGVSSAQYLFTASAVNYTGWSMLDHSQYLTINAGADLHEASSKTHLSVLVEYGSGLHTGPDLNETVPSHCTVDVSLRHKFFSLPLHPELAVDVLNALDEAYVLRIANGYFDGVYGPLRRVDFRLTVPFGG